MDSDAPLLLILGIPLTLLGSIGFLEGSYALAIFPLILGISLFIVAFW